MHRSVSEGWKGRRGLWRGALVLSAGVLLVGCSDDGDGDSASAGGGQIASAEAVGVEVKLPFDATPSPEADAVYFTAVVGDVAGVYKVPPSGGTPQMVSQGFTAPVSLVMSTDGKTIYVADLALPTEDADASKPSGAVFTVPATGGDPSLLAPTKNYSPRSIDLISEGSGDVLYFSGQNPKTGVAGVYRLELKAGSVAPLYEGPDLREPGGIGVADDGVVYVVDAIGANNSAGLLRVSANKVETVLPDLLVGYPAGIALDPDGVVALISGRNVETGGAQVYRIDLTRDELIEIIDMGISQNTESGGLHRAHNKDNYAWSDLAGTVYLLGTKNSPL